MNTQSYPIEAAFHYHRVDNVLHVALTGMTNHELRAILIGFWLTLDLDDREDHIAELQHYLEPDSRPPSASLQMAQEIKSAQGRA